MAEFILYPAIDLRGGKVVRLVEGDPARQTEFGDDPAAMARRWAGQGAQWLHVVNLDGAFGQAEGARRNWAALEAICQAGPRVQFGGGLRGLADVGRARALGVARVALGTAAVEQPELVRQIVERWGAGAVAVALDARAGEVKTRGWQAGTGLSPFELGAQMAALGVRLALYTDIERDGGMGGANAPAAAELARATGLGVLVSGGVAAIEDIRAAWQLRAEGVAGAIIGRALYDGTVDLAAALAEFA